jgi:hypothetical protein
VFNISFDIYSLLKLAIFLNSIFTKQLTPKGENMKKYYCAVFLFPIIFFGLSGTGWGSGSYEGDWAGTTSQRYEVSFTVINDQVTTFKIKYKIIGFYCSSTVTSSISGNFSIIGNSFSVSTSNFNFDCIDHYEDRNFTGIFDNVSTCSGNWEVESCYCDGEESGTWTAFRLRISVFPESHDFGRIPLNSSSSQTFSISNKGALDLEISSITIGGKYASHFIIENDNCSAQTLAPGETATFDMIFSPNSAGNKEATITIQSNDPVNSAVNVQVIGTATGEAMPWIPLLLLDD